MEQSGRRDFLRAAAGLAAGAGLASTGARAAEAPAADAKKVDRRVLGRIGREVSIYGLGLGSKFLGSFAYDPEAADAILRRAIDVHGINYWDTASDYSIAQQGKPRVLSQQVVGETLKDKAVRDRVFMVTKSGKRDYDGFKRDVETSLKLLQTDHIDLYHMHNLPGPPRNTADAAAWMKQYLDNMEQGCVKAAREFKEQGVIKAIGVTGHTTPTILIEAIKRFDPDAFMSTFPAGNPERGYEEKLLPLAVERKMGCISMKSVLQARAADIKGTDLVRYSISLPGIAVAIVGNDSVAHLDENAAMATNFKPLALEERAVMNRQVRLAVAGDAPPWLRTGYRDGVVIV